MLVLAALTWFAWPRPIAVDLATVTKGPMEVTVDDEGKTRVRHIYTVSAPIAGKVLRISHPFGDHGISRHVGDLVTADETVVAVMQPMTPGFIDARSREELEAAVAAADAAVKQAEADIRKIQAALDFARTELQRAQALARTQTISTQAFDKAKFDVETNEAALTSAKAQLEVRQFARTSLAARLIDPTTCFHAGKPDLLRADSCAGDRSHPEDHSGQRSGGPSRHAAHRHRRPRGSRSGGGPAFHRCRPDQGRMRRCGSTAGVERRSRGA